MFYSICLILLSHSVFLEGQTITIFENNQEDNVTNCTSGIVSDVDAVVFKAEVDYSQDINIKLVYFQLKKKGESDYWFIEGIDVHKHCNGTADKKISCEHIKNYIVLITIRIIAKREYSVARIRGVIIASNNQQITSDAQNFPLITDSTDINGTLFIDGIEKTRKRNTYSVITIGPGVNFNFECKSKVLPCLIEMSGSCLINPIKVKGYVSHIFPHNQLNVTIKLSLCTLDRHVDEIFCNITTSPKASNEQGLNDYWKFGLFGCIPMILFLYLLVFTKKSHQQIFKCVQSLKKIILRTKKDSKKREEIIYADNGIKVSLLVEAIPSSQEPVTVNKESREKTVRVEVHTYEPKHTGEITSRKQTDEDFEDQTSPDEIREKKNVC